MSFLCENCSFKARQEPIEHKLALLTQKCPLCRMVSSASKFVRSLQTESLRSYTIDFNSPIRQDDIEGAVPRCNAKTTGIGDRSLQCSGHDCSQREGYIESITKMKPKAGKRNGAVLVPVTTIRIHRNINFHCHIPLKAFCQNSANPTHDTTKKESRGISFSKLLGIEEDQWSSTLHGIKGILYECQNNHAHCQRNILDAMKHHSSMEYHHPIRLLRCCLSKKGPEVCLEEFNDRAPPYLTLSHRWSQSQPWKITRNKIDGARSSIPYDQLPKTFRDAITITAELGIGYLWADSMCIIQDDSKDWENQSSQMGLIFARSLCTLAAIDAFSEQTNEDQGLGVSRDAVPAKISIRSAFTIEYEKKNKDAASGASKYTMNDETVDVEREADLAWENPEFDISFQYTPVDMSIERSVWNTRGWILQERLLSKRILYFTKEQLLWECPQGIFDESSMREIRVTSPSPAPTPDNQNKVPQDLAHFTSTINPQRTNIHLTLLSPPPQPTNPLQSHPLPFISLPAYPTWPSHSLLKPWLDLTTHYTTCTLTFSSDRWAAIQGLCSLLRHRYASPIHAGIWATGADACLLWHARTGPLAPCAGFRAPSWSWMGWEGGIGYAYGEGREVGWVGDVVPLVSGCEFDVGAVAGEEGGEVRGIVGFKGALKLSCRVRRVGVSEMRFGDLHFCEETGRVEDPSAQVFFGEISGGRSGPELQREYRIAEVPPRTRLLMGCDEGGQHIIGWVVLDREEEVEGDVICAAIVVRVLHGRKGAVQEIVECLVLEEVLDSDPMEKTYRRVGRGRVVEKGWLECCKEDVLLCI